jgi:hypothetical protein
VSKPAVYMALAGCLSLGSHTVMAMTSEKMQEMTELVANAKTMWSILPARASDAKKTAMLIKDLEAFAKLPARPGSGASEAIQRNCTEAACWLKKLLPKQYTDDVKNTKIKAFTTSSSSVDPLLIPKTLHFIWLGSPIPEKYLTNIGAIAALNEDYQINIWLDDQSHASADSIQGARCKIRHVDQILNHPVASWDARNIYSLAVAKSGSKPNFAAGSDVLRILIRLSEGGIYLDTDTYIENVETAHGFGQLKAKYGFLVSTQAISRDGPFNNSPMAAVSGSPVLRELLALAEKRYRDASHVAQPPYGRGPEAQSWLYWVAAGSRSDMRLNSTVFIAGPVLVWDYLSRLGHGWLKEKNIELDGNIRSGPPEVELFEEEAKRVDYACSSSIPLVEDYYFMDNIYGDFDLTAETFGLCHKFDHSWLNQKAPVETKDAGGAVKAT